MKLLSDDEKDIINSILNNDLLTLEQRLLLSGKVCEMFENKDKVRIVEVPVPCELNHYPYPEYPAYPFVNPDTTTIPHHLWIPDLSPSFIPGTGYPPTVTCLNIPNIPLGTAPDLIVDYPVENNTFVLYDYHQPVYVHS